MTANFARMTLSLTRDIREGMRRYPNVNWSAVARRAFSEELLRLSLNDTPRRSVPIEQELQDCLGALCHGLQGLRDLIRSKES